MELIKVSENTYYIKNNTNIGVYKINDNEVYIIDSGNDNEAGKKVLRIAEENNWKIIGIINTHSNADHIGGNEIIQKRTNCIVISNGIENSFIEYPILEASFLYGGYPFKDIRNKFLLSVPSNVSNINNIPKELEYFNLKGHFFNMIGIKTPDNIYFLGDSIFSEETINKYHIFFIYDVKEFLNTLDFLEKIEGKLFIPSHAEATNNIKPLININRNKVLEIIKLILDICKEEKTFEDILKILLDKYSLTLNANQYVLVGSTLKSYLSYLYDNDKIKYRFIDNRMYWETI